MFLILSVETRVCEKNGFATHIGPHSSKKDLEVLLCMQLNSMSPFQGPKAANVHKEIKLQSSGTKSTGAIHLFDQLVLILTSAV